MSASPTTVTATAVVRARTDRGLIRKSLFRTGGQPIAGSANGLHAVAAERTVDLAAKVRHVNFDGVRVAIEGEIPGVSKQVGFRHDLARSPREVFDDRELFRSEIDYRARAFHGPGGRINEHVADLHNDGSYGRAAPKQRSKAGF